MSYYQSFMGREPASGETPTSRWDQWVWPLVKAGGAWPTRSDGFGVNKRGGKGHFGVDIMHRRPAGSTLPEEKNSEGKVNAHYAIWVGERCYVPAPGKVFSSEMTKTGWCVKISHRVEGRPILSVYRHLKGSTLKAGDIVKTMDVIGEIGDNPDAAGDPPHLHFELWDTSLNNVALMERYRKLVDAGKAPKGKYGDYLKWVFNPASVMDKWGVRLPMGGVVPHGGDPGDPGEKGGGSGGSGGSGGGAILALLAALGLGFMTFGKSRRRGYV